MKAAKVLETSDMYKYFKDITLVVGDERNNEVPIYGCITDDEEKFYRGILEYDNDNPFFNFENVQEI